MAHMNSRHSSQGVNVFPQKCPSIRRFTRLAYSRQRLRNITGYCRGQCHHRLRILFFLVVCITCVTYLKVTSEFILSFQTNASFSAVFGQRKRQDVLPKDNAITAKKSYNDGGSRIPQNVGRKIDKVVEDLVEELRVDFDFQLPEGQSPWKLAESWVTEKQVIQRGAPEVGAVLRAMATSPIIHADTCCSGHLGTQLKLSLTLAGGQKVVFKPKWYERYMIVNSPEPYAGMDRHNGEIAAFHLSRILGLNKTPMSVGRVVNVKTEILPVASSTLRQTFYTSGNTICFHSQCDECKNDTKCIGEDNLLEGAVILWLPREIKDLHSPWARTYNLSRPAKWELNSSFCEKVRRKKEFHANGYHLLLDAVDAAVLDFLTGNADRHDYEVMTFKNWGVSVVMLDNGKSFGNPFQDERTILAPLYQCCSIRKSTWNRLKFLQYRVLSQVLQRVTTFDPIFPLLTSQHLQALDRRLGRIVSEVEKCAAAKGENDVFL